VNLTEKWEKDFITSREAAKLLGVALSTVQSWTENGLLRAWKTNGGHRRIARNSVEQLLIEQRAVIENRRPQKQMTIVIVEDEPLVLQLYKEKIDSWNFDLNIITAKNGFEGLIQIGRWIPNVIITDMIMPDMDGFQMINALKRFPEFENSLTIIVSILTEEEIKEREKFKETNIVYFQKPISFKQIKKILGERVVQSAQKSQFGKN